MERVKEKRGERARGRTIERANEFRRWIKNRKHLKSSHAFHLNNSHAKCIHKHIHANGSSSNRRRANKIGHCTCDCQWIWKRAQAGIFSVQIENQTENGNSILFYILLFIFSSRVHSVCVRCFRNDGCCDIFSM